MRAAWLVRSRQMVSDFAFWLAIIGYNRRDRSLSHRIYLGDGIFGDLTLVFQAGSWQTLAWTFPDYASAAMLAVFSDIRRRYRRDLREKASAIPPP